MFIKLLNSNRTRIYIHFCHSLISGKFHSPIRIAKKNCQQFGCLDYCLGCGGLYQLTKFTDPALLTTAIKTINGTCQVTRTCTSNRAGWYPMIAYGTPNGSNYGIGNFVTTLNNSSLSINLVCNGSKYFIDGHLVTSGQFECGQYPAISTSKRAVTAKIEFWYHKRVPF